MDETTDGNLPVERQDVFDVLQVTRSTSLESLVGADLVEVAEGQVSSIHRHNRAETVLYFLSGTARVVLGDDVVQVRSGDRVRIGQGVYHGVRTPDGPCSFLSVQVPPILDKATGILDLEPLEAADE